MRMKRILSIASAAMLTAAVPLTVPAQEQIYPSQANEYKEFAAEYPEYYRIQGDSVYFLEHSLMGETDFVISSEERSSVERVDFGYVFTPEEDGCYVIFMEETMQECVGDEELTAMIQYKNLYGYIAEVDSGEINVTYMGSREGRENGENTPCIENSLYFSFVNGVLPDYYNRYITTVYGYNSVESYFCLNSEYTENLYNTDVTTSDNKVAYCCHQMGVSGELTTDDIMAISIVRAVSDGEAIITLNDEQHFAVTVENGIFTHAEEMTVLPTNPEPSYESQGILSFGSLPDKTAYAVGESLDLTGLTVSLDYYFGADGHRCIYDRVSPMDYPEAFIVDASDFDSTTAGTYEIKVSCTPEIGTTYWATGTISFEVTVSEQAQPLGDVNADGKFSFVDLVMFQKWLFGKADLTAPQNAYLCKDGKLDAFDLAVMKRMLIEQNMENTPPKMPLIMDHDDAVTNAERENLWTMLSCKYPDMDFSDFTFVYDPDHPLSDHYNGKLFSIYYKNILLHGYGNINCDSNVFAVVGGDDTVNFVVDPKLFTQVDSEQEILSPLDVIPTCIDVETPELILYVDAMGENPPRLAYRAVDVRHDGEYILDAVTGESIEYIPYYVV